MLPLIAVRLGQYHNTSSTFTPSPPARLSHLSQALAEERAQLAALSSREGAANSAALTLLQKQLADKDVALQQVGDTGPWACTCTPAACHTPHPWLLVNLPIVLLSTLPLDCSAPVQAPWWS
jgi:hypothetical protein